MVTGNAFKRVTTRQFNFEHLHLLPGPARTRTPKPLRQVNIKFVQPHNRIGLWNLEPGDRVYVRSGSMKGQVSLVDSVSRHSGQVYLKGGVKERTKSLATRERGASLKEKASPQAIVYPPNTHYSNLSLMLSKESDEKQLVATRLKASRLRYSSGARAFQWRRTPEAVRELAPPDELSLKRSLGEPAEVPMNSTAIENEKLVAEGKARPLPTGTERIALWHGQLRTPPKREYAADIRDTKQAAAVKDTFFPKHLVTMQGPEAAPELAISAREFGDPNSRARRTDRWNAKNRTAEWKKIKRPPAMRRLARVNWEAGLPEVALPVSSKAQEVKA